MKLAKFTEIISSNIMLKKFMKKIGSYLIALWEVSEALILLWWVTHSKLMLKLMFHKISKFTM